MNDNNTWNNQKAVLKRQAKAAMEAGRSGLQHTVFGRTLIILLLTFAQGLFFAALINYFHNYSVIGYVAVMLLNMICVLFILNHDSNPSFKLSWLILVLALPVIGTPTYLIFHSRLGSRRINERIHQMKSAMSKHIPADEGILDKIAESDVNLGQLARYIYDTGGYPPYSNTDVKYFPSGESFFDELILQLTKAEKYIYLEFFIIGQGHMWEQVLSVLRKKAESGVDVRVLYDGSNSLLNLPYHYDSFLSETGIPTRQFSPIIPLLSPVQNNRDHRKIVVIDGKAAFTGGVNLADEYINLKERFGHWKDNAVLVSGPAVKSFTAMFLQLWNAVPKTGTPDVSFPDTEYCVDDSYSNQSLVIPYAETPYEHDRVAKSVYFDLITHATKYIHIFTPYLVLDHETETALRLASKKGIDVSIIIPHVPDKKYVYYVVKNNYHHYIADGINIYEYTPGFVHSKTMVVDDKVAVVGSVNTDYRSFYLNFENAVLFTVPDAVRSVEEDFVETAGISHQVTMEECTNYRFRDRLPGWLLAILAPLM